MTQFIQWILTIKSSARWVTVTIAILVCSTAAGEDKVIAVLHDAEVSEVFAFDYLKNRPLDLLAEGNKTSVSVPDTVDSIAIWYRFKGKADIVDFQAVVPRSLSERDVVVFVPQRQWRIDRQGQIEDPVFPSRNYPRYQIEVVNSTAGEPSINWMQENVPQYPLPMPIPPEPKPPSPKEPKKD